MKIVFTFFHSETFLIGGPALFNSSVSDFQKSATTSFEILMKPQAIVLLLSILLSNILCCVLFTLRDLK